MTSSIESKSSYGPVMTDSSSSRNVMHSLSRPWIFGDALAIFERLHQIPHGHFKIQPTLCADVVVEPDALPRLLDLLSQHLLIERHHDHVVEVECEAGVVEHPNDVGQVIQLVFGKELVVQIEAAEDHVDLRHVVLVGGMKRVVQAGDVRPRGIEQPEIVQTASAADVREKAIEELQVAFAIEDHHRDFVRVIRWTYPPLKILRDDVFEQSCLATASHAENDSLHHPHLVGPYPWLAVNIVSEDHAAFLPRATDVLPIRRWIHDQRRIAPLIFSPFFALGEHQNG